MATNKQRIVSTTYVTALEWNTNNLEEIEAHIGPDVIDYSNGVLTIVGVGVVADGYNIIATDKVAYAAGPPVVNFVPGQVIEILSDAALAAKYEDIA